MTSWALGERDEIFKNTAHCGCAGMKQSQQSTDMPGSLYSSNFDISSINNIEKADWLKWRCYIKFTSKALCLITVVPDNVDVIRRLLFDHKGLGQILSESLYYDMESRADADETVPSMATKNGSCSVYTSCSSARDLEEQEEFMDKAKEKPNFRLRASTWDAVGRGVELPGKVDDRLRTNSLGARIKPLPRLRSKRSFDFESKEKLLDPEMQSGKFVPLILPVYICKCPLTDVISYLIYNHDFSQYDDGRRSEKEHDASSLIGTWLWFHF